VSIVQATKRSVRWGAIGAVGLGAGYAALVGWGWLRYGHRGAVPEGASDPLLDTFLPAYDVSERHSIQINAPAAVVLAAAKEMRLDQSPIIRTIFRAREIVLGATPDNATRPTGLLDETQALGWRTLAEVTDREVVVGAVTQPWLANVVFRGLAPDQFTAFSEPNFVKIAWTLRADPIGPDRSVFRTETRVSTTDSEARSRFRWYWARFSPGIWLIRSLTLRPLKHEAERRHRSELESGLAPAP
jgi:hypothetical protein